MKLLIGESRLHGAESLLPFDLSSKRHEYSTTSSGGKVDYMQILFQHRKNDPTSIELVYKLSKVIIILLVAKLLCNYSLSFRYYFVVLSKTSG